MSDINVTIFDKPSGHIAGVATVSGVKKRIAHAYLTTDKGAEITIDKVAQRLTIDEARDYIKTLTEFVDRVDVANYSIQTRNQ
jgi:hypothetical protein